MQYRRFGNTDLNISALGFGAMRMPTIEKDGKTIIDEPAAIGMIRHAIDNGINYVDTAYFYHDGQSEVVVGKALQDGYRERTYIATKSPVWLIKEEEDFEKILDEQMQKLQVDYIDFYLLHALDKSRFKDIVLKYDLINKMIKLKEEGKIKYMGFSFHDSLDVFKEIIDSTDQWDFCQIQFNYIDITHQAGQEGLEYAGKKGIPVVIMEPLLGGKLANLPKNVKDVLDPKKDPVEWALDFLWDRPEVALLLSGMSTPKQLEDNLIYADRSFIGMLKDEEKAMLKEAKRIYDTMALVSCTKCRYCLPCPSGLLIPDIFEAYNMTVSAGMKKAKEKYDEFDVKASDCVKCRACEIECPQHIEISQVMTDVDNVFAK
ncbi:MAG: aldo/keto reductase [Clostridiales bacterium]|jgi:predicted aldo/keto reductase-like oxidoreductase|nr:aldo/keto reductase [Clostridiales bacterium]